MLMWQLWPRADLFTYINRISKTWSIYLWLHNHNKAQQLYIVQTRIFLQSHIYLYCYHLLCAASVVVDDYNHKLNIMTSISVSIHASFNITDFTRFYQKASHFSTMTASLKTTSCLICKNIINPSKFKHFDEEH